MNLRHCKTCDRDLPGSDFYKKTRPDAKAGLQWRCKSCSSEHMKGLVRSETPAQRAHRSAVQRANWYRATYGISLDDFNRISAEQGGVCASCARPPSGNRNNSVLHVDHDHKTGAVRGLLCGDCNRALGILRDDPDVIWQLLLYSRKNQRRHLRLVA